MTREEAIRIAQGLITDFKCKSETMVDFCNTVIEALEQEPCEDCIRRQAVLDIAKSSKSNWIDNSVLFKRVNKLPSVTPQYTDAEIQKMQEMEQAQLDRAYELGKTEMQHCEDMVEDLSKRVDTLEKQMKEDREEQLKKLKAELDYAKFCCALPNNGFERR